MTGGRGGPSQSLQRIASLPPPPPLPPFTMSDLPHPDGRNFLPDETPIPSPLASSLGSFPFLNSPSSSSKPKLPPFSPSAHSLTLATSFDDSVAHVPPSLDTPLGASSSAQRQMLGLTDVASPSIFQRDLLFGAEEGAYMDQFHPAGSSSSSSSAQQMQMQMQMQADWRYPTGPPLPLLPDPVEDKNSAAELQKRYKDLSLGSKLQQCEQPGCSRVERKGGRCMAHNATICGPACQRPSRIDGRCLMHLQQSIKTWSKEGHAPTQFMDSFHPDVTPFSWPDSIIAGGIEDGKLPPGVAAIAARIGEPNKRMSAQRVRRKKDPKSPKFTSTYVRKANYGESDVKQTLDDVWQLPEDGLRMLFITYKKLLGIQIKHGMLLEIAKQPKSQQMCTIQEEEIRCLPYGFAVIPHSTGAGKLYIAPDGRQFVSVAEILRKLEPQTVVGRLEMSAAEFYCYMEGAMGATEAVAWKNALKHGEEVEMTVRLQDYKMVKKFIGINSCRMKLSATTYAVSCLPIVMRHVGGRVVVKANVKVALQENKPSEI